MPHKPLVFISCGQYAESERELGRAVYGLLEQLRPDVEPYFAENQSTPEGLSQNILKALTRSAGFICIMHRRGVIETFDDRRITRGSVWIEQAIAIVATMNQILGRAIRVLYYRQAGVSVEGIRSVLIMNPRVEFKDESEVLDDLRSVLPSERFYPYAQYDVEPVLSFSNVDLRSDRHVYLFCADVKNTGQQKVTDLELRLFFPRKFLLPIKHGLEDTDRSTKDHCCYVAKGSERSPDGLYPGDNLRHPITLEYFVDDELSENLKAMQSEIRVDLFSESMEPKTLQFPIKDFLRF